MQNIKKYFMTLALLIMATGAWAQTPGVKLFTVPAEWADDNTPLTAADLPADFVDYSTLPDEEAKAIPNPDPSYSHAIFLFYGFKENDVKYILWVDGTYVGNMTVSREDLYKETTGNHSKIYYTVELTEWSLTPDTDKKVWTLDKMPASDIELQVEYFAESNLFLSKDALADKANIAVKNGETTVEFDAEGKSTTTVTEGNTVTVTYTGSKKVIGVKAEKKAAVSLIVNPVVGQIIGSDGKNYDANATLPDGVKAVAMIAYVGNDAETSTTYNHGLALALEDVSSTTMNWCSQADATCLGTQYDTNTKFNDLAGIANTDALVNHTGHTHAAAIAARGYNSGTHPAGTSAWFLPSAGQWYKMSTAAGSFANLKTNAGLNEEENYWSSTECSAGVAWDFDSSDGSWYSNSKTYVDLVRACLAF